MRFIKTIALAGVLAMAGTACADLDVENLNNPDRQRVVSTPQDVEGLIAGSFRSWWSATQYSAPSSALSTAADAHSSSWGNWGMRDFGWEPRKEIDNTPQYNNLFVLETPWSSSYAALAAVADGIRAIEGGITIRSDEGTDVTNRAIAFGKFVQAISLATLAQLFDQAFIVDETTDVETVSMVSHTEVWAAALQKFNEAASMAGSISQDIPSSWVGCQSDWSASRFQEMIRVYKTRYMTTIPRTPGENDALDWNAIRSDAEQGMSGGVFGGFFQDCTWPWSRQKLHTAGISGWARIDYRTVGPADASGGWENWINTTAADRQPFNIDTDDSRVTGGAFDENGTLFRYLGSSPFPPSRGTYHFSHYIDKRYNSLWQSGFVGLYPEIDERDMLFLEAEANLRASSPNPQRAMQIVNDFRANGGLPPFTSPTGPAPGGDRCVPQMPDGSCGDLMEALQYEKRIELFHQGFAIEYFDDRRWGDLVSGTALQFPVPASELELLLMDLYTFGGDNPSTAPNLLTDISPEAIKFKKEALERYRERTAEEIGVFVQH